MTQRIRPGKGGFTLLEVLASAMIFAMVVTVLIGSSSETVFRVGLTASRLEASEIADRELATLEADLNMKRTPTGEKEETRDIYRISVTSQPALDDFGGAGTSDSTTGGESGLSLSAGGAGVGSLLVLQAPGIDQFLLRYEIIVEWIEGAQPDRIRRTTYGFDWEAARLALPELFKSGDAAGALEGLGENGAEAEALLRQLEGATP